jgi:GTPase Era involved in 16S rRNA processing
MQKKEYFMSNESKESVGFVRNAEKLQEAFNAVQKFFQPDFVKRWLGELEQYKEFAANPIFQVAVVGAVKAGKSTFLNAILGDEFASTEVTPETASLTIFKYASSNYVKVKFLSRAEWDDLWASATKKPDSIFSKEFKALNGEQFVSEWVGHKEIVENVSTSDAIKNMAKRYSSSKSVEHYFVKELEIGISQFPDSLPREIVFVDTPGLDDVVPYRSDITKRYITRANAVIVCVNAKVMQGEQLRTIVGVFEQIGKPQKVMVLGTQADTFTNPGRDWEKNRLEWSKNLGDLYKDEALMHKNLIGVSSVIFAAAEKLKKEKQIEDNQITTIAKFAVGNNIEIPQFCAKEDVLKAIRDNLPSILTSSGIPFFFESLQNGPLKDSDIELQNDLSFKFTNIENEVKNQALDIITSVEEQLKVLNGTVEEKEKAINDKKAYYAALDKYATEVEDSFNEMRNKVNAAIAEVKSKLDSELKTAIGG